MDDFTATQLERDHDARLDGIAGDRCRRWVTCTRCAVTSPELECYSEVDVWENNHAQFDCTATKPAWELIDPNLQWWAYPERWVWTYMFEPEKNTTVEPAAHWYYTARDSKPLYLEDPR